MAKSWERTAAQILPVATGLWSVQTSLLLREMNGSQSRGYRTRISTDAIFVKCVRSSTQPWRFPFLRCISRSAPYYYRRLGDGTPVEQQLRSRHRLSKL